MPLPASKLVLARAFKRPALQPKNL